MDIQCNGAGRAKITSKWTFQGLETACSMPDHPRTASVRIASGPDGTSAASSPSITQPDERTDWVRDPSDERSEQTPVGIASTTQMLGRSLMVMLGTISHQFGS